MPVESGLSPQEDAAIHDAKRLQLLAEKKGAEAQAEAWQGEAFHLKAVLAEVADLAAVMESSASPMARIFGTQLRGILKREETGLDDVPQTSPVVTSEIPVPPGFAYEAKAGKAKGEARLPQTKEAQVEKEWPDAKNPEKADEEGVL